MAATGPYEPYPCGSGKKYKWCCQAMDREAASSDPGKRPEANSRYYEELSQSAAHLDARYPIDLATVKILREIIAEAEITKPNADSLIAFIEPLVIHAEDDREMHALAVILGNVFWNLSLISAPALRNQMLETFLKPLGLSSKGKQDGFRLVAHKMYRRHRLLFPDLHKQESQDLPEP